jgi:subtilase family serine protease
MSKTYVLLSRCLVAIATVLLARTPLSAQQPTRRLITKPIDDSNLVTLRGNTHRAAMLRNDRGPVDDATRLDGIWLLLKRPAEKEKALVQFLEEQQDPKSPNYHKWITAQEMGTLYGPAPEDIATVNRWLESHGFTVNHVYPHGVLIDFKGTAGQIRETFHTELRNLEVKGKKHFANISDPRIPAALGDIVAGPVQLHNFMPHRVSAKFNSTFPFPPVTGTQAIITPGDLQTIYNFGPAYAAGYTGAGVTIAIPDDTDVYTTADWGVFRKAFGLAKPYPNGSLTQTHPAPGASETCTDPGTNAFDYYPIVHAEWASAAAPNASIVLASCADSDTSFGAIIALQNLVTNGGPIPGVICLDFVLDEADMTGSGNAYVNSLYQTIAAAGASLFVASGNFGAADPIGGDFPNTGTISVNAYATTPFNVAVGGTDFGDVVNHFPSGTYWNSTTGTYYNSALSYVPEIAWNDTCADLLLAQYEGYSQTYGSTGYCNNSFNNYTPYAGASGGGPSTVYAKPAFQSGFAGNPADGQRDIPDIAILAAEGVWGHSYVDCFTDPINSVPPFGESATTSCAGPPATTWNFNGGTSFSTPIAAGIMALVVQKKGANQGNPVARIYAMAGATYGGTTLSQCNSSGPATSSSCIFYDVTQGDNDVNCVIASPPDSGTSLNCYMGTSDPEVVTGVLSTSTTSYAPAYPTGIGWDFPTGIGSINVFNFVINF